MSEDETAVAWRAMPYRAIVVAAGGPEIGTAESLLADDQEDIFAYHHQGPSPPPNTPTGLDVPRFPHQ